MMTIPDRASVTAVLAGVAFLGWMWGAVGAIVAVPLVASSVCVEVCACATAAMSAVASATAALPMDAVDRMAHRGRDPRRAT